MALPPNLDKVKLFSNLFDGNGKLKTRTMSWAEKFRKALELPEVVEKRKDYRSLAYLQKHGKLEMRWDNWGFLAFLETKRPNWFCWSTVSYSTNNMGDYMDQII